MSGCSPHRADLTIVVSCLLHTSPHWLGSCILHSCIVWPLLHMHTPPWRWTWTWLVHHHHSLYLAACISSSTLPHALRLTHTPPITLHMCIPRCCIVWFLLHTYADSYSSYLDLICASITAAPRLHIFFVHDAPCLLHIPALRKLFVQPSLLHSFTFAPCFTHSPPFLALFAHPLLLHCLTFTFALCLCLAHFSSDSYICAPVSKAHLSLSDILLFSIFRRNLLLVSRWMSLSLLVLDDEDLLALVLWGFVPSQPTAGLTGCSWWTSARSSFSSWLQLQP